MTISNIQDYSELLAQNNGEFLVYEEGKPKMVLVDPEKYAQLTKAGEHNGSYVLVTGGAGYIGSHAVQELLRLGHKVIVLDNLSTGFAANVNCQLIVGDVGDIHLLDKIFTDYEIEAVMHFAASIEVEESVFFPGKYFQNNVVNGINLLNAMVRHGVNKIIFSSTAAVYGDPKIIPINEDSELKPTNPYGESKLMFEKILHWYQNAYDLSVVILRYFNASGASIDGSLGDRKETVSHLIPRALRVAAKQDEVLKIFGTDYNTVDGTAVRDYIHVVDLANAHILALDKLKQETGYFIYNVGTGKGYSVAQVADATVEITRKMVVIENGPRRPGDPERLVADATRIKSELGFEAKFSDLNTIITTAWAWHCKKYGIEIKKTIKKETAETAQT